MPWPQSYATQGDRAVHNCTAAKTACLTSTLGGSRIDVFTSTRAETACLRSPDGVARRAVLRNHSCRYPQSAAQAALIFIRLNTAWTRASR